ncbi:MAG: cytochrome c [Patulibacter minatonensis]
MLLTLVMLWVALLASGVVAFGVRARPDRRGPWPTYVWPAIAVAVLSLLVAIPYTAVKYSQGDRHRLSKTGLVLTPAQMRGRDIFATYCRKCHTLADANAASTIGPNFDALPPTFDTVVDAVTYGRARGNGQMPRGLVNAKGARDVADYLTHVAGR